jgi:DNA-binding NarL/FixJ family response regulator
MSKLRVLIADDHEMMREGLCVLVNRQSDMETVGEADNGRAALALAAQLKPDVVVMDVSMPQLNGLKATERLKKLHPEVKVLTLTRHADDSYMRQLLQAGSCGYVLKNSAVTQLINAIRAVAAGHTYLDPALSGHVLRHVAGSRPAPGETVGKELSGREEEVLRLIAWGYANKEIADRLDISAKTVDVYKARAMEKLDMRNRIDIVRYALLRGWLQDD